MASSHFRSPNCHASCADCAFRSSSLLPLHSWIPQYPIQSLCCGVSIHAPILFRLSDAILSADLSRHHVVLGYFIAYCKAFATVTNSSSLTHPVATSVIQGTLSFLRYDLANENLLMHSLSQLSKYFFLSLNIRRIIAVHHLFIFSLPPANNFIFHDRKTRYCKYDPSSSSIFVRYSPVCFCRCALPRTKLVFLSRF